MESIFVAVSFHGRRNIYTCLMLVLMALCLFTSYVRGDEGADKSERGYIVGIDLGTTYSCVGVWKSDRVQIIPNDQGNRILPSYVAFSESGKRLIGDAAKNQASLNPRNTIYDVKRLIGRRYVHPLFQPRS